jgi:hypothetical protein
MRFDMDSSSLTYDDSGTANGLFTSEHITYVGQVDRSGCPHGMGRFTDDEQHIEYLGEWRAGHWHGWGKLVQANGDVLEGQWDRGVFSGEGRLSQTEGGIYDGQWQYNRPCGEGRYVLPDGTVYSGIWGRERDFADPFESEKPTSSTGSPRSAIAGADGSEEMGAPEAEIGIGTIRYPNRAYYDGEWRNLRPHGTGKLRLDDGSEYKGEFEDGLFHGKGRLRYANKGEYEGEWRNGRKQGQGRMLHPDGKVEIGHWKRDRLVEPAQDKEDYVDATQSWLMPDRHKPASVRGVPAAEVIGPSEPRGKWAGRYSGTGTKPFGDIYADDDLDEDEQEEEEELGGGPSEFVRRNDGLTQGYRKSSSHSRWEPLKGRGRT